MNTTLNNAAGLAAETYTSSILPDRIASPNGRPLRKVPLVRKYEVAHLTPSHDIGNQTVIAPAIPPFEDAFAAFGRGAIVTTDQGPVAIEDLLPGDRVQTNEHGFQTLIWHGEMTVVPTNDTANRNSSAMTRVSADTGGYGHNAPDLVLGPAARVLRKSPHVRVLTGAPAAFIPAQDLVDAHRFIALHPMSPVQCYQIGFARHCSVSVNGVDVETLHPGPAHMLPLNAAMLGTYLSLFPHVRCIADFGAMAAPRLRQDDLDLVAAA